MARSCLMSYAIAVNVLAGMQVLELIFYSYNIVVSPSSLCQLP